MGEIIVSGLIGVIGTLLGFAGAARLDSRRFEREKEVRWAEGLQRAATDLADAVVRVAGEAGPYIAWRKAKRFDNPELLRPAHVALAEIARAIIVLRRYGLPAVSDAAEALGDEAHAVYATGLHGDAEALQVEVEKIVPLRNALFDAIKPYALVLHPRRWAADG